MKVSYELQYKYFVFPVKLLILMYLTSKYVLVNKNTSLFQIKYSKKKKGEKIPFH